MKIKVLTLTALALAMTFACTKVVENEVKRGDMSPELIPDVPAMADTLVDLRVFNVLNLDYPGLETVKKHYDAKEYYLAAYQLREYFRTRTNVYNPLINLVSPSISDGDLRKADQALEHRFYVKNYYESKDPSTGVETYWCFDEDGHINWEITPGSTASDQEWRYQKHRHQWMEPQARAYAVTRDEKYVKNWIEVYSDWLATYPCPAFETAPADWKQSPYWTDLQASERIHSQLSIFPAMLQADAFTPEWLCKFLLYFAGTVDCVTLAPYHDKTSNHYFAQIQALMEACVLLPELKEAPAWEAKAFPELKEQLELQFFEDGVHNEFDPSYHLGVVADFLSLYNLARVNGKVSSLPSDYITRLNASCHFLADLAYQDFTLENYNDTRTASTTASVVSRNIRSYSDYFPEDMHLKYIATRGQYGEKPRELQNHYPNGGYYIMRSDWGTPSAYILVHKNSWDEVGQWHNQSDNGTIAIWRNGRHFLPDAGCYSYGGTSSSNADRAAYASTKQHSTLVINDGDIAKANRRGRLIKTESTATYELMVTENPSYEGITHRRSIYMCKAGVLGSEPVFVVVDEAYGSADGVKASIYWKLCADKTQGAAVVAIDDHSADHVFGAHTTFSDKNNLEFRTFTETTDGYAGAWNTSYYSDQIGEKTQRRFYSVSLTKSASKAARFITVIRPVLTADGTDGKAVSAEFIDNQAGSEGTFHSEGARFRVTIDSKSFNN